MGIHLWLNLPRIETITLMIHQLTNRRERKLLEYLLNELSIYNMHGNHPHKEIETLGLIVAFLLSVLQIVVHFVQQSLRACRLYSFDLGLESEQIVRYII